VPRVSHRPQPASGEADEEERRVVPTLREPNYSQSVERGLAILECFRPAQPVRGIAEIAEELGMSRSTTHRYMFTLQALGYLEQVASRKYRLGLHVIDLGMSALNSMDLREHAHEPLAQLRDSSGYAASLATLDGAEIVYLDRARSHRRGAHLIDRNIRVGSRLPAHATAMGKLLLAHLAPGEQRKLLAETRLAKCTAHTITAKTRLRDELQEILEQGIATSDQEQADGLYAIAAPVRSETGEVLAAAGLCAHISMISLDELVERLAPHLIATADRISARLGYRRRDELA
jgi:IclR family pca regulon transcriptional regulator